MANLTAKLCCEKENPAHAPAVSPVASPVNGQFGRCVAGQYIQCREGRIDPRLDDSGGGGALTVRSPARIGPINGR